mmetsp:Transcript_77604/g.219466  ORF Transcript_77604/g.219466 Transcript_77604/m.219466 type:complete len:291 (+) Transcript_77604:727-1599(+)
MLEEMETPPRDNVQGETVLGVNLLAAGDACATHALHPGSRRLVGVSTAGAPSTGPLGVRCPSALPCAVQVFERLLLRCAGGLGVGPFGLDSGGCLGSSRSKNWAAVVLDRCGRRSDGGSLCGERMGSSPAGAGGAAQVLVRRVRRRNGEATSATPGDSGCFSMLPALALFPARSRKLDGCLSDENALGVSPRQSPGVDVPSVSSWVSSGHVTFRVTANAGRRTGPPQGERPPSSAAGTRRWRSGGCAENAELCGVFPPLESILPGLPAREVVDETRCIPTLHWGTSPAHC